VADYLPPMIVEITGRDESLARALDSAKARIREFAASVGRLDARIAVTADAGPAKAVMDKVEADAKRMKATVPVRAEADGASWDKVKAEADELAKTRTARIRFIVDKNNALKSQLDKINSGLIAVASNPALQAVAAGMAGAGQAAGGLAAAVAAAGVSVGVFGLAAKAQFTGISAASDAATKAVTAQETATRKQAEAQALASKGGKDYTAALSAAKTAARASADATAAYKQQLAGLPPATQQTALAFLKLKTDYQSWSDRLAGSTMPVFTEALDKLDGLLPKTSGLVKTASGVFKDFLDHLGDGGAGATFSKLGQDVQKFAGTDLAHLLTAAKNVATGIGGIVDAFLPYTPQITAGLDKITGKFEKWGQQLGSSSSFKDFMQQMKSNGPGIADDLKKIADAAGHLGTSMGGFTASEFKVFGIMADGISKIPAPVLEDIATVLPYVVTGIKAWTLAQTALDVVLDANPVGAFVMGVTAMSVAVYELWEHSETFRKAVELIGSESADGFLDLVKVAIPAIKVVNDTFMTFVGGMLDAAAKAFGWVPGLGGKLKTAAKDFDGFKTSVDKNLDAASKKVDQWQAALEKVPSKLKIEGDISDLQKKVAEAQKELKTAPMSKQAKLTADISKWQMGIATAKTELVSAPSKKVAILTAQISQWQAQIKTASAQLKGAPSSKKAVLKADISQLSAQVKAAEKAISGIKGKTVTIYYRGVNEGTVSSSGTYTSTNGYSYAQGGIHVPGMRKAAYGLLNRPAGFTDHPILWGEAGPEAYIPLSGSKRGQARAVAAEAVGILGGQVAWGAGPAGASAVVPSAGASAGGGALAPVVNITVQGHVLTERQLVDVVEQGMLRKGARRSTTYQPYKR